MKYKNKTTIRKQRASSATRFGQNKKRWRAISAFQRDGDAAHREGSVSTPGQRRQILESLGIGAFMDDDEDFEQMACVPN